jgi:hypothetical protein
MGHTATFLRSAGDFAPGLLTGQPVASDALVDTAACVRETELADSWA